MKYNLDNLVTELEELDKKNVFDIEDYIKRKGKVKLNRNTVITRL